MTSKLPNLHGELQLTYKKGFIFTLLFRVFNICSSYTIFHEQLLKFKLIMMRNDHPVKRFDFCARNFLDKLFHLPLKPLTTPKRNIYFTFPFTGKQSMQIRPQVTKLFASEFPHIQLRVVFKPIQYLSNFFRFKDRIILNLRSRIVYQYKCQSSRSLYVGVTTRHLHTRMSEYMISPYTGKTFLSPHCLVSCLIIGSLAIPFLLGTFLF